MNKWLERIKEIEARKADLRKELAGGTADEARLSEIKAEAEKLSSEEAELRGLLNAHTQLAPAAVNVPQEERASAADAFRASGHMAIPMFMEGRSVLVSSGKLALPKAVSTEIGTLPEVISSIVDDVDVIDATGTGSWEFPYQKTEASAADVTEGQNVGGTGATFDKVEIGPGEWGVLDEVSNQVMKMTNVNYAAKVQRAAYLALRKKAKEKITAAVLASNLLEKKYSIALDQHFVRKVVLGFDADESVAGGCKMYINKADLATLGQVRGTNEKKAVFEIEFTDENNGTIKDGATVIRFSINSSLPTGQQLYGQPQTIKMLLWDNYEISTDDGGDYFKRNMLGIRGIQTAGANLAAYHGMQLISQAAAAAG